MAAGRCGPRPRRPAGGHSGTVGEGGGERAGVVGRARARRRRRRPPPRRARRPRWPPRAGRGRAPRRPPSRGPRCGSGRRRRGARASARTAPPAGRRPEKRTRSPSPRAATAGLEGGPAGPLDHERGLRPRRPPGAASAATSTSKPFSGEARPAASTRRAPGGHAAWAARSTGSGSRATPTVPGGQPEHAPRPGGPAARSRPPRRRPGRTTQRASGPRAGRRPAPRRCRAG